MPGMSSDTDHFGMTPWLTSRCGPAGFHGVDADARGEAA